jgi:shikimate dehydrogenase
MASVYAGAHIQNTVPDAFSRALKFTCWTVFLNSSSPIYRGGGSSLDKPEARDGGVARQTACTHRVTLASMTLETRAFLFAHPARHSLSPVMHNAALRSLGITAQYEARDVPPDQLEVALNALRGSGIWGVNLSIPHKERALEIVDSVSDEARSIGAINTVIVHGGKLEGRNTDAPGFMRSLKESGLDDVKGLQAVVLGAGGAARGVVFALKHAGARVSIWNRTGSRAQELASEFGLKAVSDSELEREVRGCGLLVNTTSVGLEKPDESPLSLGVLPESGWVCDIVYRPLETRLLREAKAAGLRTVDGLGMLVHQGALALSAWTGRDVPVDVMRQAALAALGER